MEAVVAAEDLVAAAEAVEVVEEVTAGAVDLEAAEVDAVVVAIKTGEVETGPVPSRK